MIRQALQRVRRKRLKREAQVRVLMVCRANYCRSPMAEGVFGWRLEAAGLAERVFVDSAGLHGQLAGQPPDLRGRQAAATRGIDLSAIRSRPVDDEDLELFDYILAVDSEVYNELLQMCRTPAQRRRVQLLMRYGGAENSAVGNDIPDPYYGGSAGFENVLQMLERAADGLLQHIRQQHGL